MTSFSCLFCCGACAFGPGPGPNLAIAAATAAVAACVAFWYCSAAFAAAWPGWVGAAAG